MKILLKYELLAEWHHEKHAHIYVNRPDCFAKIVQRKDWVKDTDRQSIITIQLHLFEFDLCFVYFKRAVKKNSFLFICCRCRCRCLLMCINRLYFCCCCILVCQQKTLPHTKLLSYSFFSIWYLPTSQSYAMHAKWFIVVFSYGRGVDHHSLNDTRINTNEEEKEKKKGWEYIYRIELLVAEDFNNCCRCCCCIKCLRKMFHALVQSSTILCISGLWIVYEIVWVRLFAYASDLYLCMFFLLVMFINVAGTSCSAA